MGGLEWATEHLFELLANIIGIGGLFFTAFTIREDTKARKISNLLAMTESHRDVWQDYLEKPALWRVTAQSLNLSDAPIRPDEEVFVNRVILHLSSMYEALKEDVIIKQEGLQRDVTGFFSLPLPKSVWEKTKHLQNRDFVKFVSDCIYSPETLPTLQVARKETHRNASRGPYFPFARR